MYIIIYFYFYFFIALLVTMLESYCFLHFQNCNRNMCIIMIDDGRIEVDQIYGIKIMNNFISFCYFNYCDQYFHDF